MFKFNSAITFVITSLLLSTYSEATFAYAGQKGVRKIVESTLYCGASKRDRSASDKFTGIYDEFGFQLYHAHIKHEDENVLIYGIIEGKKPKSSYKGENFIVTGEIYSVPSRGPGAPLTFEIPQDKSPKEILEGGFEGYQSKNDPERRRKCKVVSRVYDLKPSYFESQLLSKDVEISKLHNQLKDALENTDELDKAVANNERLSNLIKEIEKELKSAQKSRGTLSSELKNKEQEIASLKQELKSNSSSVEEKLQIELSKNASLSSELESTQNLYSKLLVESEVQAEEANRLTNKISVLTGKVAELESNTPEKYAENSAELARTKSTLEQEIDSKSELQNQLKNKDQLLSTLSNEIKRLKKSEGENSNQIAELSKRAKLSSSLKEELKTVESENKLLLDARDRVIASLYTDIDRLNKELEISTNTKKDLEIATKKISSLENQVKTLSNKIKQKNEQFSQLRAIFGDTSTPLKTDDITEELKTENSTISVTSGEPINELPKNNSKPTDIKGKSTELKNENEEKSQKSNDIAISDSSSSNIPKDAKRIYAGIKLTEGFQENDLEEKIGDNGIHYADINFAGLSGSAMHLEGYESGINAIILKGKCSKEKYGKIYISLDTKYKKTDENIDEIFLEDLSKKTYLKFNELEKYLVGNAIERFYKKTSNFLTPFGDNAYLEYIEMDSGIQGKLVGDDKIHGNCNIIYSSKMKVDEHRKKEEAEKKAKEKELNAEKEKLAREESETSGF